MKFHKQICLFLAFFVLVSNAGFAVTVHDCDDQIASVSFNTASPAAIEEDCCGVVEKISHCCKDRIVVLQKKSDQAVVKSFSFEWQELIFPEPIFSVFSIAAIPSQKNKVAAYYCDSNAPPLFKLYSQYIFYDQV